MNVYIGYNFKSVGKWLFYSVLKKENVITLISGITTEKIQDILSNENWKRTIKEFKDSKNKSGSELALTFYKRTIKKKERLGYTPELFQEKNVNQAFFPQRISKQDDEKILEIKNPYIQLKMDGNRMYSSFLPHTDIFLRVGNLQLLELYKHGGRKMKHLTTIIAELKELYSVATKMTVGTVGPTKEFPLIFDGELYDKSFKQASIIAGLVNKDTYSEDIELLKFYIFDYFDVNNPEIPFKDRYKFLEELNEKTDFKHIIFINSYIPKTKMTLKKNEQMLNKAANDGYEGLVIKDGDLPYKPADSEIKGDSKNYKMKLYLEEDYEIIDILPVNSKKSNGIIINCKTIDDLEFSVTGNSNQTYQKSVLDNKDDYIGQLIKIEYRLLSNVGKPLQGHPVLDSDGCYVLRGDDR